MTLASFDGINFNDNNIFENLPTGDYNIYVSNAANCTANFPISITEPDEIGLILKLDERKLIAEVEGGTAPYKYLWSDGSKNSSIDNPTASSYTVMVTDENGCMIEG